jgi:hypothetical protein
MRACVGKVARRNGFLAAYMRQLVALHNMLAAPFSAGVCVRETHLVLLRPPLLLVLHHCPASHTSSKSPAGKLPLH